MIPYFYKSFILILTKQDKLRILRLSIGLIIISILEVLGLALIAFLLINFQDLESAISSYMFFKPVFFIFDASKYNIVYLFCLGILVYSVITLMLSIVLLRAINFSSQLIGSRVRLSIMKYYLYSDWMELYSLQAAQQISNIFNDGRQMGFIVGFCLNLLSRLMLALIIIASLLLYNSFFTFIIVVTLISAYIIIFLALKPLIAKHGQNAASLLDKSLRTLLNIFNSIKEIIFYNKQQEFISIFNNLDKDLIYSEASNVSLSQIPRFIIDTLILMLLVSGALYISNNDFNNQTFFATLSVYGLAALKLLPALQNIYYFYHEIVARQVHLSNVVGIYKIMKTEEKMPVQMTKVQNSIEFVDVAFTYKNNNYAALSDINLYLDCNKSFAIVGPTGSGKSTFLDILLGFTVPQSGYLKLDEKKLPSDQRESIRGNFSYVPQKVFILEATLKDNITFGSKINEDKLDAVLKICQLKNLIDNLPQGIETKISESTPMVSGGQKQCIGFARALYKDTEILIIDEATNAMDKQLENKLITSIKASKIKSIISITHKPSMLNYFDEILVFDSGKLSAAGSLGDLSQSNEFISKMINSD